MGVFFLIIFVLTCPVAVELLWDIGYNLLLEAVKCWLQVINWHQGSVTFGDTSCQEKVKDMQDTRIDIYQGPQSIKLRPYEHHVKYYETDQMGIVHHSNYIRWMEEARMDYMSQIGLDYKQMEEMEIISPVLEVHCQYKSMVHFSDTVVIETKVTHYNGIKMSVAYRMTDKETGELRTVASSEHSFLNRCGKPLSLKRSYPELDTRFFQMMDEES